MKINSLPWYLWLIPIALLLIATARLPYGYYTFMRIAVRGIGALIAWYSWDELPVLS